MALWTNDLMGEERRYIFHNFLHNQKQKDKKNKLYSELYTQKSRVSGMSLPN